MAGPPGDIASKDYVQTFARGLDVIRAFDAEHPRMTLSEVAARTGLTRAATRRFLLTLVAEGYAVADGKTFGLAPRTLDLGYAYLSSLDVWEGASTVLTDVTRQLGESCSASVLDGDEIVYVARVAASRIMAVGLRVGSRLPAFHTSMGRMLLAHRPVAELERLLEGRTFEKLTPHTVTDPDEIRAILRRTAQQGWSLTNQELELGLMSIAVPLRDRAGRVTAAINVSSQAGRTTPEHLIEHVLPVLLGAAGRIISAA
ncbi:IclR family transcriptional regulator C-terminal domain-containing protein [Caulobacter sp. CCNWLY153]|uniref:IclR family transcriptional regulator domain-containing protein n=1 Tax=unclassified Caulobacter TaxID=2648921 RepID=UPI002FF380B6